MAMALIGYSPTGFKILNRANTRHQHIGNVSTCCQGSFEFESGPHHTRDVKNSTYCCYVRRVTSILIIEGIHWLVNRRNLIGQFRLPDEGRTIKSLFVYWGNPIPIERIDALHYIKRRDYVLRSVDGEGWNFILNLIVVYHFQVPNKEING